MDCTVGMGILIYRYKFCIAGQKIDFSCSATILAFCDIENDIRRFGEEFMVEIYRQH